MRPRNISVRVILLLALMPLVGAGRALAGENISWWDQPRKGTNGFNNTPREQWFADAAAAGIRLVRLTPSKWKGEGRDFLLGNADEFKGIPAADLTQFKQSLDWVAAHGIRIVVTPLSLPGARWSQQNDGKVDDRLYKNLQYHQQAARFWKELAMALKDHPAVAGYNLINEPAPERALGVGDDSPAGIARSQSRHADTAADVNVLYRQVIAAIREVDTRTPIILDASSYGTINGLSTLRPVADGSVLYSVHFYDPWYFNTWRKNQGALRYGTRMTLDDETFTLDKQWITARFDKVADWAKRNNIPANRIFIGEIGCDRRIPGAKQYLDDIVQTVNAGKWHWAFYSFREDQWDAMDYELGTAELTASVSELKGDARETTVNKLRGPNPLWDVWAKQFKSP